MPTQYGELKNGLRAYITWSGVATRYDYWDGGEHFQGWEYTVTVNNAGIMAPAPISNNITLARGDYSLYEGVDLAGSASRAAHTFAKGNTDRWQQVFQDIWISDYEMGHSAYTVPIKIRRETSPVYQTTANVTIPAKPSYTVSYNPNGGSGAPGSQTKWADERLTLSSTRPTRTGYTFAGWATSSSGAVAYQPGGSYTANSAVTLYAKWTPISVTLSYNANGGSGAPASQTKVYDTSLKLQTSIPTRTGYTFKGWATTQARANAGTVDYSAGGTYSANSTSNITLWAAWSPNPYAVTYNANGGSGAPASQTKYHGTNLTLQSGVPVKAGWLFRGWATSEANATARKNSGTAEYLPGGTYTGNEPLTLWAIWHAIYTYSLSAKRVGADKSSTEDTNGEWVRIEVSITSAEAAGNPITAITFTDEETAQSVSWYATNDGSGSAITFPYQPAADNIKLYAWYQRTTASERAERYNLSVQVDDAIKTGDIKTTTLPPVFRLIDAKPPGKGIAFGKTATKEGMEIAMPVDIEDKPLTISNATINQVNTTIDLKEANNGITAAKYYAHVYRDKNNKEQGRLGFGTLPDGRTRTEMYVRNYDTNGNMVGNKGFAINMDKTGNITYSVTTPSAFRKAIDCEISDATIALYDELAGGTSWRE